MMFELLINLSKLRSPSRDVATLLRRTADQIEREGVFVHGAPSPGQRTKMRFVDYQEHPVIGPLVRVGHWLVHGSRRHLRNHDARVSDALQKFDA